MTASAQEAQPKGWRDLTPEERKALSPAERSRARLRDINAKQAAEKRRLARVEKLASGEERKRATRRKILIGTTVDAWTKRPTKPGTPDRVKWLHDLLDAELTRDDDRALFDLPPRAADAGRGGTTDFQEDAR